MTLQLRLCVYQRQYAIWNQPPPLAHFFWRLSRLSIVVAEKLAGIWRHKKKIN